MLPAIQTAVVLLSLVINHPAMAAEIRADEALQTPLVTTVTTVTTTTGTSSNTNNAKELTVEATSDFTSPAVVKKYVEEQAIKKGVSVKLVLRIVKCESGFIPQQSKYKNPLGPNGREDSWGPWQINLPAHPGVTRKQAMDVEWSTAWSLEQIKQGNVKMWSCY